MDVPKNQNKPFAFWLVERLLPPMEFPEEVTPLSNKEFYGTLVLLSIAILVLALVFHL